MRARDEQEVANCAGMKFFFKWVADNLLDHIFKFLIILIRPEKLTHPEAELAARRRGCHVPNPAQLAVLDHLVDRGGFEAQDMHGNGQGNQHWPIWPA